MSHSRARTFCRILVGLLFILAGIFHFVNPSFYATIVPEMFRDPLAMVYISGFFEILGGIGILIPQVRVAAGWGLIALLVAVFPANIKMFHDHLAQGWNAATIGLLLRLPLQLVFIYIVKRVAIDPP